MTGSIRKTRDRFGFSIGVLASENAEVGFIYGLGEPSSLVFGGTNEREVGDLDVTTYHGYFAYNWGAADIQSGRSCLADWAPPTSEPWTSRSRG